MSFGLQIVNQSGDLTVSSSARMLHYIGKPLLQGVVQTSGRADGTRSSNPRVAGHSIYRLWSDQPFVIAMDVPVGRNVGVVDIYPVATGVYDIRMYCGEVIDADGFDVYQHAIDIFAFAFVGGWPATDWGLALYDNNGNLSADFSRRAPLWPQAIVEAYSKSSYAIPYLARPLVLGMPSKFTMQHRWRQFGMLYDYIDEMDFWHRPNATTLAVVTRKLKQYQVNEPDEEEGMGDGPGAAIIIEGANLY